MTWRALAAAALVAGMATTGAAAAQIPDGAAKPNPAAGQAGAPKAAFSAGAPVLIVTFGDRPARPEVLRRLDGLGEVRPVVPEAGIWSLRGAALTPSRATRRQGVVAAEWSRTRTVAAEPRKPFDIGEPAPVGDPLHRPDLQWGLFRGNWSTALAQRPRPRLAVLDSGVDRDHPEWRAPGLLVAPFSSLRGVREADDHSITGHGTHVAGIAAAPIDGVGVVGAAPARARDGEVIPVQIADRAGRSTDDTMMRGIRWAVRNGAKVVNISAGGPGYSRAFQDTILWATQRGAIVVASVGNEGGEENGLNYPAAYPRVLGVGAECDGERSFDCPTPYGTATFSNRNRSVDVIAPGVSIISTIPRDVREGVVTPGYGVKDGTSMATPMVAGVAALVMANNPDTLSPFQVHRQITNTAIDVGPRGRDTRSGAGIVNPQAAVTLPVPGDDTGEVNDDIKFVSSARPAAERARSRTITAVIDQTEDPDDVYGVVLRKGDRVRAQLDHPKARGQVDLYLWKPKTRTVRLTGQANLEANLADYSGRKSGRRQVVAFTAERSGRHYLNVFARRGGGDYTLRVRVTRAS